MYKLFSGEKCIHIVNKPTSKLTKDSKTILFHSKSQLHAEYRLLIHSNDFLNLFIVGNEETVWAAFRSLFVYIEAAGGLVFNPSNELLMIYRNNHWDLPKGKMEKGELNHQTALREVEEECGITNLTITKQLTNTYHIFNNHAETIKCTYWFKMKCDDTLLPTPQTEEGIEKAQWMNQTAVQQVYSDIFLSLKDILTEASFLSS